MTRAETAQHLLAHGTRHLKAKAGCTSICPGCEEPIVKGERFVRARRASRVMRAWHQHCVESAAERAA